MYAELYPAVMALTEPPSTRHTLFSRHWFWRLRWFLLGALTLCAVVGLCLLAAKWPFTRNAASQALQHELGQPVQFGSFHPTFFPPGYVAENIRCGTDLQVRKLVVISKAVDLLLLRRRVEQVLITGLRFTTSHDSLGGQNPSQPRFSEIGRVQFTDVLLQFPSFREDPHPLTLAIKSLTFRNINRKTAGAFAGDLIVNKPQGQVRLSGYIGPWNWQNIGLTPLTGMVTVPQSDLATFAGVRGSLQASARFTGPLNHVICYGTAQVPDFQVSRSSHAVALSTTFRMAINGLNADVTLEKAESHFNRTLIESKGFVKEDPQLPGKTASLEMSVEQGQVSDVLLLFTRAPQPSMAGLVDLRMKVDVPPGTTGFLKRITVTGDFGIDQGHFTKSKTQKPLNHLSESATGIDRSTRDNNHQCVLSDVAGHVSLASGLATLSQISFAMPGAHGVVNGTYDVLNQAVNLEGRLLTTGQLSSAASGMRAVLLKIITPFLTRHSVTTVPFSITGTAEHPNVELNLLNRHRR